MADDRRPGEVGDRTGLAEVHHVPHPTPSILTDQSTEGQALGSLLGALPPSADSVSLTQGGDSLCLQEAQAHQDLPAWTEGCECVAGPTTPTLSHRMRGVSPRYPKLRLIPSPGLTRSQHGQLSRVPPPQKHRACYSGQHTGPWQLCLRPHTGRAQHSPDTRSPASPVQSRVSGSRRGSGAGGW